MLTPRGEHFYLMTSPSRYTEMHVSYRAGWPPRELCSAVSVSGSIGSTVPIRGNGDPAVARERPLGLDTVENRMVRPIHVQLVVMQNFLRFKFKMHNESQN